MSRFGGQQKGERSGIVPRAGTAVFKDTGSHPVRTPYIAGPTIFIKGVYSLLRDIKESVWAITDKRRAAFQLVQ